MLCFFSPDKGVRPLEELVERHPPLTELGDDPAQGGQATGEPLYALDVVYRAHVGDGCDLFWVSLDTTFGHDVSKQLPLQNPKNTFFGIQLDIEPSEVLNIAAKFAIRSQARAVLTTMSST